MWRNVFIPFFYVVIFIVGVVSFFLLFIFRIVLGPIVAQIGFPIKRLGHFFLLAKVQNALHEMDVPLEDAVSIQRKRWPTNPNRLISFLAKRWWMFDQLALFMSDQMTRHQLHHALGMLDKESRLMMVPSRDGILYKLRL
ncbi:MAG: hypothetical protein AB7Q04_14010 [Steroidobacteraceae bacterium]